MEPVQPFQHYQHYQHLYPLMYLRSDHLFVSLVETCVFADISQCGSTSVALGGGVVVSPPLKYRLLQWFSEQLLHRTSVHDLGEWGWMSLILLYQL